MVLGLIDKNELDARHVKISKNTLQYTFENGMEITLTYDKRYEKFGEVKQRVVCNGVTMSDEYITKET